MSEKHKTKAEEAAEERANQSIAGPSASAFPNEPPPPAYESVETPQATRDAVPTVSSPFDFPSDSDLPPYEPPIASPGSQKPIAIPQVKPDPAVPFVPVFSPALLSHGVTPDTWYPFLDTLSAFLTAKVSDRAISHAGDMAKHLAENPKNLGNSLLSQTKGFGKTIAKSAKSGNVIGAATQTIGAAISIPVSGAVGLVGTILALPSTAIGAIVKKPKTPGQRAAAYAAVANEKWLHTRGLHATMMDSNELAHLLSISVSDLLRPAQETKDRSTYGQLEALEGRIAPVEVRNRQGFLELAPNTIWLVLAPIVQNEGGAQGS